MKLAAAYVRASTEEQAMRGYSIEARRDAIRKYARENGYKIIAEYSDEGVSGKKPCNKRPALSRFMEDIQNGMAVDVLLFCKLDRFYRSVKLYYQAVEILDRCGVAWKAILENYETETATGALRSTSYCRWRRTRLTARRSALSSCSRIRLPKARLRGALR